MPYSINVNGRVRVVDADEDMPLLWALRDNFDLKGTKFGCGAGLCGACTVHLDGAAMRSCQIAVSSVGKSKIVTIEAVGKTSVGQKVKQSWIDIDVAQCGYCQAGQIMTAVALLSEKPKPTDTDIDDAMSGNACRCATYTRIRAAIKQAAGLATTDTRST